jgi:hypothetical protein
MLLPFGGCKEKGPKFDFSKVESVEIVDGKNGEEAVFNTKVSNGMLQAVENIMSSRKFQRDKEEDYGGYKYMLSFKDSSKSIIYTIYIVSENIIMYDGLHYTTDNPMDLIFIDSLYCT